jgi:hypothetical protein
MSEASQFPSAVPQDETILPNDEIYAEKCKALLADDAKEFGWHFKNSLLTKSDKWGLVWRVDVQRANASHLTRLAIWRAHHDDDGYGLAYFSSVKEPLPAAS